MEKAVLKTLIYADFFDYPLKAWEIQKWLIETPLGLQDVEKTLKRLIKKRKVRFINDFYALPRREKIVGIRLRKEKISAEYFRKAKFVSTVFKIIPWIKLVGISGGLAMENAGKKDDIDLFVVTSKNRLWISRLLMLVLLTALRLRRKSGDGVRKAAGKVCLNLILEEDRLEQKDKNLYTAHEVLQMKPLLVKDACYAKYLDINSWAFEYLPSWATGETRALKLKKIKTNGLLTLNILNNISMKLQIQYMSDPKGSEKIEEGAVYFHPVDYSDLVLKNYSKRVAKLSKA